jgi:potassium/chloride transporter 9
MFGRYAEVIFGQAKVGTNPILAVLLTFVLMMACLLIGSLNKIAQLSSVLFLLSYLTVNMACLFMEWASAPNFRPKFKSYRYVFISMLDGTIC